MNNKIWFKAKRYGWGWYPASWQGWVTLLIFLLLMFANVYILSRFGDNPSPRESNWFFIREAILLALLILICFKKGEKPGWRWGNKDENKKSSL